MSTTRRLSFASDTKPENFGEIKKAKPIVRNLEKRKALQGTWYYTNKGVIAGPYDAQTMRSWLEGDHIVPSLEIRMVMKANSPNCRTTSRTLRMHSVCRRYCVYTYCRAETQRLS